VESVEIAGQHKRAGTERFELDHTFDLPWTRTRIVVEQKGGKVRESEVVNERPDPVRTALGAVLAGGGIAFTALGIYDVVTANGGRLPDRTPYVFTAGGVALGLGIAGMGTGWHPASDTFIQPDCARARSR
jgi:hypothetical protein